MNQLKEYLLTQGVNNYNVLLIVLLAVLIILAVIFYYCLILKHKRDKVTEFFMIETRIAKRIHDELANDLYNTITYVENQNLDDSDKKEKLLAYLDNIYIKIKDISKSSDPIDIGDKFSIQLKQMLAEFSNPYIKIITTGINDVKLDFLDSKKKIALYRTLQELLISSAQNSNPGIVVISFKEKNNFIDIDYSYNGKNKVGDINKEVDIKSIENRIVSIKGSIQIDLNPKSLRVKLNFPS